MPTPNRPNLFGLAATGLIWLTASTARGQGESALPALPSTDAPTAATASASAAAPSSSYSVLLLRSGKVISGKILRDATGSNFVLKEHGAAIGYPAEMVATPGNSMEELYQYQFARLALRDADERMKLARWSLTNGLPNRAKEQLNAILEMDPGDSSAEAMRYSIAASDESMVDKDLRRTSTEMPVGRDGAPAPLSPGVVKKVRQSYGRDVFPVIFDLPQSQAVIQAQTFTQRIQPILQNKCAGCHNEKYDGPFQLIAVKLRRDMTPDVARANLDATLKLVNPDDLSRSELLSSGLVPHGGNKSAIFRGPNDVEYQRVFQWVRGLRPPRPPGGESVARTGYNGPAAGFAPIPSAGGDRFASDRGDRQAVPGIPVTPLVPVPSSEGFPPLPGEPTGPQAARPNPNAGFITGDQYYLSKDYSGGYPDSAFPVPYAAGGEPPAQPKTAAARTATRPTGAITAAAGAKPDDAGLPPLPATTPTMATQVDARTVMVQPTEDPRQLPGMNQQRYPPKTEAVPGEKKAKTTKVDPKLLEQIMKQRNGTP